MIQESAIEMRVHAKLVSDGLASEIASKILQLLKGEFSALPGTRNQVLLLAQTSPTSSVDESKKNGMWSTSRCIYDYYSNEVLTADEVDFAAENGAKSYRFRVGIEHSEQRVKLGMPHFLCVFQLPCPQVRIISGPRGQGIAKLVETQGHSQSPVRKFCAKITLKEYV